MKKDRYSIELDRKWIEIKDSFGLPVHVVAYFRQGRFKEVVTGDDFNVIEFNTLPYPDQQKIKAIIDEWRNERAALYNT